MIEIRQAATSTAWLDGPRRLSLGTPGEAKPVGERVSEMRIDYGPGDRRYFVQRDLEVVLLRCGGDKRTQSRDIAHAIELAGRL